jgi:ribulose-phosphate 3-epimerase
MAIICPTITAYDTHEYRDQMEQVEAFAERIHIDLMDGELTPKASPDLDQIWWPENLAADVHLMYKRPHEAFDQLLKLRPNLIVIHFEADANHTELAEHLHDHGIKAGLALVQNVSVDEASQLIEKFDHILVFSGHLGFHGGEADLGLLGKVEEIRAKYPDKEISWDGGINDQNAKQLADAGVDVLNTGGYIQKSADPQKAYATLKSVIEG